MFEKVLPGHPDKLADRIAGALVDLAYKIVKNPRIAVEVLLGHGQCVIIAETSVSLFFTDVKAAVRRITGNEQIRIVYKEFKQDPHLAFNQMGKIRCGDNGIFLGCPISEEEEELTHIAGEIWNAYPFDGKMILDDYRLIICQSNAAREDILRTVGLMGIPYLPEINPLGDWTGGIDVDTGATNRKLGSDMGGSITGGGLHGKDLSKADVTVNIYAFLEAQKTQTAKTFSCAIGDESVNGIPYEQMVERARQYIEQIGGFEKFAEWGLIRPEEVKHGGRY